MDWVHQTASTYSSFWTEKYVLLCGSPSLPFIPLCVIRPSGWLARNHGLDTRMFYVAADGRYTIAAGPFESAELAKLTLQLML